MNYIIFSRSYLFVLLFMSLISCSKDPVGNTNTNGNNGGNNGGGNGNTEHNIASFEVIPIPGVNLPNVGVLPTQIFCSNAGPYLHLLDFVNKRSTILKYTGDGGSGAWLSYPADTWLFTFAPTNLYTEPKDGMGFYWTPVDPDYEYEYVETNLGNGSPSFNYWLTGDTDPTQPQFFHGVYGSATGTSEIFGIVNNEIWVRTGAGTGAGTRNQFFDKIYEIPGNPESFISAYADPDQGPILWARTQQKLYQLNLVGKTVKFWDFESANAGDINAITKADGKLYIAVGINILRLDGDNFVPIGALNLNPTGQILGAIDSDGKIVYGADGSYFDANSNTWKSFIGSGQNLDATDQGLYNQLKQYIAQGFPLVATKGGGPVYICIGTDLIKISPKFN